MRFSVTIFDIKCIYVLERKPLHEEQTGETRQKMIKKCMHIFHINVRPSQAHCWSFDDHHYIIIRKKEWNVLLLLLLLVYSSISMGIYMLAIQNKI
jgi:hypothetical protein